MSDIKLFQVSPNGATEIPGASVAVEKSLQNLMEKHLEAFLGVRFLASEHVTGKTHGGRVDTLGIDENGCPVIIEYKRALNENVINQGLFYLDWLLDHKAEFTLLVLKRFGAKDADAIEWAGPRLLCIAGDFTKYDVHAVQQINRNIELIRYRRYGDGLLLLELVNATSTDTGFTTATTASTSTSVGNGTAYKGSGGTQKTITEQLTANAGTPIADRFEALKAFLVALGDDVQVNTLKYYMAFKRIKNFACIEVHPASGKISVFVKVDPDTIVLEDGFTRDVRRIGHYGTGELEITLKSSADLEKAEKLLMSSYEAS